MHGLCATQIGEPTFVKGNSEGGEFMSRIAPDNLQNVVGDSGLGLLGSNDLCDDVGDIGAHVDTRNPICRLLKEFWVQVLPPGVTLRGMYS